MGRKVETYDSYWNPFTRRVFGGALVALLIAGGLIFSFVGEGTQVTGSTGPSVRAVPSPAPVEDRRQVLVDKLAEFVATHAPSDKARAELQKFLDRTGCTFSNHSAISVETLAEAQELMGSVPGFFTSFHRITYGENEGTYYVLAVQVVC